jgi:hypothetical protein
MVSDIFWEEETVLFRALVLALIWLGVAALPAAAQMSQSSTTTSNLNVRQGPGTQFAIIGQVPRGQWIHVTGCTTPVTWCKMVFGNLRGWVSANYLNPRPTIALPPGQAIPVAPPPPVVTPLPLPQPTAPTGFRVVGTLTNEGVSCQAMRGDDGQLYTLTGNLGAFRPGDRVVVVGPIPQSSICMQGTTIRVNTIERAF